MPYKIEPPHYPIVYVRGYAMTENEREETFHDTYYGYRRDLSRETPRPRPPITSASTCSRGSSSASEDGEVRPTSTPPTAASKIAKTIPHAPWVCAYDDDVLKENVRDIEDHAQDLYKMICELNPRALKACGVDLGRGFSRDYKVTLVAYSMGGLVCCTLIQNILPARQEKPKDWIHPPRDDRHAQQRHRNSATSPISWSASSCARSINSMRIFLKKNGCANI